MSPESYARLLGVFTAAMLLAATLACGGASATPPPPPPVSLSLDTTSATVLESTAQSFTATVVNDVSPGGVRWTVSCSGSSCGSVSPNSTSSGMATTYTAPGPPASDLTVTLKAASVADSTKSVSATITVPALSVSLSTNSATVQVGAALMINGTVNNDPTGGIVNWTLQQNGSACSPACGTIDTASGTAITYTAPATPPGSDLTVTVTGTSVTDKTKSASATLLVPSVGIIVAPPNPTVVGTKSTGLTATLVNDPSNAGVTWTVSCPATPCGGISQPQTLSGIATTYTAPAPPASDEQVTVTATSVANHNAMASAVVTVPAIVVDVEPQTDPKVIATTTQQLTFTITNDPANAGVTWTVQCSATECGNVSPTTSSGSTGSVTYTAPSLPASNLGVTVTATSITNPANSLAVGLTVPALALSAVNPASGIIPISGTPQFTAAVSYDPTSQGMNWTLTQNGADCSPACGTITTPSPTSGTATFHGPAALPANTSVSVNAISITDQTKSSSSSITLTNGKAQLIPADLSFSCKLSSGPFNTCPPPSQNVRLTNTGVTALSITGISATAPFSQTNNCGSSLPAAGMCTIPVTFNPTLVGTFNRSLKFTDDSSDSPQQVALTGVAKPPKLGHEATARAELAATNSATVPAPTGKSVVGTRVLRLVDSGRQDPYAADGSRRELAVRLWYPVSSLSNEPCKAAEYTSPRVWNYFAQLVGVPAFPVATNSCQEAEVAAGPHPLILFTPGYTGTSSDYSFLTEDLASRGYVVAVIDHTYEATAVEFLGGRIVRSRVGSHLGQTLLRDRHSLEFALDARKKDLTFVLAELARLNSQRGSPFAGKLDLAKIALAGHSLGGLTALVSGVSDPHIKAMILMDPVLPDVLPGRTSKPVLILAADRNKWAANECGFWSNLQGPRLAISLQGTEHVALSDWIWLTSDAVQTGPMGPQKTMSAIRDYVAGFLDTNLRGEPASPLLAGPSMEYPNARIAAQQELLCGKP